MKLKWLFPIAAVLLLAPWPVAYAYDVNNVALGRQAARITIAENSQPGVTNIYEKTVGRVRPVDLFYIDTTDNPGDVRATLYLTNAADLADCYSYMILNVAAYTEDGEGGWRKATWWDGEEIPESYLTLLNGQVTLNLTGNTRYKVGLDGGSYYCVSAANGNGSLSPKFYLAVD